MRHLVGIAALAACLLAVPAIVVMAPPGCATVKPVTDVVAKIDVQKYAQNALLTVGVLESISHTLDIDPAKRKTLDTVFARAKVAIDAATRACDGLTELSKSQVDLAFADFKGLYNDLVALLGPYGVRRGAPGVRVGAVPGGGFVVADPLVFGV